MKMKLFFIFIVIFIIGCGESKEDLESRQNIGAKIRQVNVTFRNLYDNKKAENAITRLSMSEFYSEYTNSLKEVRSNLASANITDKFIPVRTNIDTLVSKSIDYINMRMSLTSLAFEISDNISDFNRNKESAIDYKYESYGRRYYLKYSIDALQKSIDFINNRGRFRYEISKYDSVATSFITFCKRTNNLLTSIDFVDTLDFYKSLLDTTDLSHSIQKNIQNIELNTDNL